MLWFKKTPKLQRLDDKVYINTLSKSKAISDSIKQMLGKSSPTFVVYYFEETGDNVIKLFEEQGIKYHKTEAEFVGEVQVRNSEINIIKAKTLGKVHNIRQNSLNSEKQPLTFLFVEHYPIFSKEEVILNKIGELTAYNASVLFYISLNEPLLQMFGSEKITSLMKTLGLKDDECVTHSFVTKSIENAQKKLEKKVVNDIETRSQDDWFKRNYSIL